MRFYNPLESQQFQLFVEFEKLKYFSKGLKELFDLLDFEINRANKRDNSTDKGNADSRYYYDALKLLS